MPEWMALIISDFRHSFVIVDMVDLAKPALFGFWAIIWLFPLKGVDRRDYLAGLDFICFLCLAGTVLLFALPQSFERQPMDWEEFFTTMIVILFLGAARWLFRINNHEAVVVRASAKKEKTNG